MRKLSLGALLLIAGWLLGWYSHEHWRHEPAVPAVMVPAAPFGNTSPVEVVTDDTVAPADVMRQLLSANEYEDAVEY